MRSIEKEAGNMKALFLIDGEHQPEVSLNTVKILTEKYGWLPVALYFLGGTEKVGNYEKLDNCDIPLIRKDDPVRSLYDELQFLEIDIVVDLSDQPVIGYEQRLYMAASATARGAVYRGSDFVFKPPVTEKALLSPSCSIIGSGKRCGKTAVSTHLCGYLRNGGRKTAVITMGRGGPEKPVLLKEDSVDEAFLLRELARGRHAASDHYEDALLSGVTAIGCRRCGGGMSGDTCSNNCGEGALIANETDSEFIIVEGSGSCVPPVYTETRALVISATQDEDEALGYMAPYRVFTSDLIILSGVTERTRIETAKKIERIRNIKEEIPISLIDFVPSPNKPVSGRKAFLACTADSRVAERMKAHLENSEDCEITAYSTNLSNAKQLRKELSALREIDTVLTELKGSAVSVLGAYAETKGIEMIYIRNTPIDSEGGFPLRRAYDFLIDEAMRRHGEVYGRK